MNKLVVLTDLGTFKAYRLEEDQLSSSPRLQPVDAVEFIRGDDRIGRQLSDQAGQFHRSTPAEGATNSQGDGERHNIWLENERRGIRDIAERISGLLKDGQFDSCYFAAPSEINSAIVEHIPAPARAKIEKNVHRDLVNAKREEILQHFA